MKHENQNRPRFADCNMPIPKVGRRSSNCDASTNSFDEDNNSSAQVCSTGRLRSLARALPLTCIALAILAAPAVAQADTGAKVKVYLPRDVVAAGESLTLGELCVIRSGDAKAVKKASATAMGRAPFNNEAIVIDRTTILSRLAAEGIKADRVQFTGAKTITVRRDECSVSADDVVKKARELLAAKGPGADARLSMVTRVQDLQFRSSTSYSLQASLLTKAPANHVAVEVSAVDGETVLAKTTLLFRVQYTVHQAVASANIRAGEIITPQNVKVHSVVGDQPNGADWSLPYGRIAGSSIREGAVITAGMIKTPKAAPVVKKGQAVVMRIAMDGFTVTAMGAAMEDGGNDDYIKVMNVDSKRAVIARVAADGAVEPVVQNNVHALAGAEETSDSSNKPQDSTTLSEARQ